MLCRGALTFGGYSMRQIEVLLTKAENLCGALAAVGLGAIMAIVASDVALRYGVGRPWPWAYDVVSIYLTVATFYLALARTLREHGHINVDIARSRMSVRTRHAFDLVSGLLAVVFFGLLGILTLKLTWGQYENSEVISSYMDWPTCISTMFVPIGVALTIARLLINAAAHVRVISSGVEPITTASGHHSIITGE